MRLVRRTSLALGICAATSCTPRIPVDEASQPGGPRVVRPDEIVVATNEEMRQVEGVAIRYPSAERSLGVEASFAAAFVVDTSGRPEFRSVTIVSDALPAFVRALCEKIGMMRYAPVIRDATPRRALFVTDWEFTLGREGNPPKPFDVRPWRERLMAGGPVAAAAYLESGRHCPQ